MDKVITALEKEIQIANKLFEKAKKMENYSNMATQEAYINGLDLALRIVKLAKKEV